MFKILGHKTFRQVMWILIIVIFVAVVIWFLTQNRISIFGEGGGAALQKTREEEPEDIFAADFPAAITEATRQGNYRMAIRLHYLQLLRLLSEANAIQYKKGRTNMDYLLQLYGTAHYDDFRKLTRNYEYAWYGNFIVDEEKYKA